MGPIAIPRFRARELGSTAGAAVFGLVAVGVILLGYLWLDGRRTNGMQPANNGTGWSGTADKWTGRLGRFLAKGPDSGTWETRYLSSTCEHYIRKHPTRPGLFLIARVVDDEPGNTQAVSRWLVPRHFFRAPSSLFFSNYRRSEGPVREVLPDGTDTWRVHWVPRAHPDGLTERRVWFALGTDDVVQIEDRSREGHLIQRVRRSSPDTGDWDPEAEPADPDRSCVVAPPDPNVDPERTLLDAVDEAPFPVYVPTHLPAGFVLVRTSYSICDASSSTETVQGEPVGPNGERSKRARTPVHLVTQLYSDGMALISVAIAPKADMDVIEDVAAMMGDGADPQSCPGQPADPRDIRQDQAVIRMRADVCRSVLRRDDLQGASVTLLGRNELPSEEYLRIIVSLQELASLRRPSK